jgi:hypothetical protein
MRVQRWDFWFLHFCWLLGISVHGHFVLGVGHGKRSRYQFFSRVHRKENLFRVSFCLRRNWFPSSVEWLNRKWDSHCLNETCLAWLADSYRTEGRPWSNYQDCLRDRQFLDFLDRRDHRNCCNPYSYTLYRTIVNNLYSILNLPCIHRLV